MNAVGAIRQIIIGDSNVTALLASGTSVFPTVLPQSKPYPAVTLMLGDSKPNDSKTSTSTIDNVQLVVGIWAKEYATAQAIDTAIRNSIDGFSGGVTTVDDSVVHYIDGVRFLTRRDDFDEENVLFYRSVNYDVRYYRDIPPLPFGTPYVTQSQAWFDALPEYDSDESAVADGLSVGDVYLTSDDHVSTPGGIPKQVRA